MFYFKKWLFLLLPVLSIMLVYGCAKENFSEDRAENMCLSSEDLKAQIQNDDLISALKNKGVDEVSELHAQGSSVLKGDEVLKNHFSGQFRLDCFNSLNTKFTDLNGYTVIEQIEIVFDVVLRNNELIQTAQAEILQKSTTCDDLMADILLHFDAAWYANSNGDTRLADSLLAHANLLMDYYIIHCGL